MKAAAMKAAAEGDEALRSLMGFTAPRPPISQLRQARAME